MNKFWFQCLSLAACSVAFLAGGCGKAAPPTTEVRGKITTKDGTPCGGALLVFHPQEEARLNDAKPLAVSDAEGNFVVRTFSETDGAVPGDYAVTVVWPEAAKEKKLSLTSEGDSEVSGGPDRLQGSYGDPSNPKIKVTVKAEANEPMSLQVDSP
jgi:hypothetical protein